MAPAPDVVAVDYRPALVQREGVGRAVREWVRALAALPDAPPLALFGWTLAPAALEAGDFAFASGGRVRLHRRRLPHRLLERGLPLLGRGIAELVGGARLVHQTQLRSLPPGRAVQVATLWDCLWHGEELPWLAPEEARAMARRAGALARSSARLQVPTRHAGAEVARILGVSPERIDLVPLGAEHLLHLPSEPLPGEPPEPGFLLTVARIDARKNHLAVLRALERIAAGGLRIPWIVAGPLGFGAEGFLEALERSPIRDRVRRVGAVSDRQLAGLYRGARAFVFPSLGEGFGLPPLEAMAFGVPVVASAGGALGEVLGDAALAVDPRDVGALAGAIETLFGDGEAARVWGLKGRERASAFSWEQTARTALESWRKALAEAG